MANTWFKSIPKPAKSFDELQAETMASYDRQLSFTDREIDVFSQAHIEKYRRLEDEFCKKTKLTSLDISLTLVAAALQVLRWALVDNKSFRFKTANNADKFVEGITGKVGEYLPAEVSSLLTDHSVPYDAFRKSERFVSIYPMENTGVSGANHRYTTLGHDPVAGWIVGTSNIVTNTMSVNEWSEAFPSYHVKNGLIDAKTSLPQIMKWTYDMAFEKPEVLGLAFIKQALHYSTDVFTKQGLPIPFINTLSPEASKFLIGKGIDVYSVTRGMALAALINKMVEMFHKLFYNPHSDGDPQLYEMRSRKIVMYSNILSSTLNVGYVATKRDFTELDVGGIIITLWRILTDTKTIAKIKKEFIEKTIMGDLQAEEDKVNAELAKMGYWV